MFHRQDTLKYIIARLDKPEIEQYICVNTLVRKYDVGVLPFLNHPTVEFFNTFKVVKKPSLNTTNSPCSLFLLNPPPPPLLLLPNNKTFNAFQRFIE
jgi:hypothetical protein